MGLGLMIRGENSFFERFGEVPLAFGVGNHSPVGSHCSFLNSFVAEKFVEGFLADIEVAIMARSGSSALINGSDVDGLAVP
jgi:hypothetical protein